MHLTEEPFFCAISKVVKLFQTKLIFPPHLFFTITAGKIPNYPRYFFLPPEVNLKVGIGRHDDSTDAKSAL